GRRIRMRMIPPQKLLAVSASGLLGQADIVRRDRKTVARRILARVCKREETEHFPRCLGVAAEQRAAAFMRIGFRAMRANAAGQLLAEFENVVRHAYSSCQKRSLKERSPESGKTVTITACAAGGSRRATSKQPCRAAPELTPASKPSSRARRFTKA